MPRKPAICSLYLTTIEDRQGPEIVINCERHSSYEGYLGSSCTQDDIEDVWDKHILDVWKRAQARKRRRTNA